MRAGLELVDMVDVLSTELDLPDLRLRVGVNSGSTAVGPGGNDLGLVAGDLVNTAARLEAAAEPGTVLVGSTTYELTNRSIGFRTLDDLAVKGKQDPVFYYEVDELEVEQQVVFDKQGSQMEYRFKIRGAKEPVHFIVDESEVASVSGSAGRWDSGVLTLLPDEARSFSVFVELNKTRITQLHATP